MNKEAFFVKVLNMKYLTDEYISIDGTKALMPKYPVTNQTKLG
jgi:hypothetical protein